jgi:hypothetical protein
MNRADYLKDLLTGRGLPTSRLTKRELTHAEVQRMSVEEFEWHQLENAENLRAAIELNPQERGRRKNIHENVKAAKLYNGGVTEADRKALTENIGKVMRLYPIVLDCQKNGAELIKKMKTRNANFTKFEDVELVLVDMISAGELYLNPAALGPQFEQRYGDELFGAYAMSRVSADDLKRMTTPFRARQVDDESKLSADEYWQRHPELARARYGDAYYARPLADMQRQTAAFLANNPNYEATDSNRDKLINFFKANNLSFTAQSLQQAFNTLKNTLDLKPNRDVRYGVTRVIDLSQ